MDDDAFVARPPNRTEFIRTPSAFLLRPSGAAALRRASQLCPAVFVPSANAIPRAVKHIYSRLAAAASELDQGVPEIPTESFIELFGIDRGPDRAVF
uniref:UmuC domain-containing protein n=1 Tax=Globodera pallida TaxID=36090 RepID=A0A183CHU9_GLOPA